MTDKSMMTETAEEINVFPPVDSWTIVLDKDPVLKNRLLSIGYFFIEVKKV
jgi:hypothetical protein